MKLLLAGDLALQHRAVTILWDESQLKMSFSKVKDIIKECDHALVNLESPVTENDIPILKDGPLLKNIPAVFDIIGYCGFDGVTLANNHLKDYGSQGVVDTINKCQDNHLFVVGAGENEKKARKPLLLKGDDLTIGIINVCEHESSIATRDRAGANPLDFPNLYQDIHILKELVDKIIVIIHGGREHYQLPTPRMKREYRMILDYGADAIVNHHQHCYSGYEVYKEKPILYGLGNFFFDSANRRNDKWNIGTLALLDVSVDKTEFQLIPYEQCNTEAVVRVLDYDSISQQINRLNSIIGDDIQLEEEFTKMTLSSKILSPFIPFGNRVMRSLYYRGLLPSFISKKNMVLMENYVSCETHREILLNYCNQKKR